MSQILEININTFEKVLNINNTKNRIISIQKETRELRFQTLERDLKLILPDPID
jgi:hypothetical protein